MNLDNLNKWITVIANVGVVAGIIFLAIEVQQNTASMEESINLSKAQAYQDRADYTREMFTAYIESDFSELYSRLNEAGWPENPDTSEILTSAERRDAYFLESLRWIHFDNIHYQYQQGYIDDEFYQAQFVPLIRSLGENWEALGRPGNQRPSFIAEVERLLYGDTK